MKDTKSQLQTRNTRLSTARLQLIEKDKLLQISETRVEELEERLIKRKTLVADTIRQHKDVEAQLLVKTTTIDNMTNKVQQKKTEITSLKEDKVNLEKKLKDQNNHLESLQKTNNEQKDKISSQQTQITNLQTEKKKVEEENAKLKTTPEKKSLSDKVKEMTQTIAQHLDRITSLQKQLQTKQDQKNKLADQVKDKDVEIVELKQKLLQPTTTTLEEQYKTQVEKFIKLFIRDAKRTVILEKLRLQVPKPVKYTVQPTPNPKEDIELIKELLLTSPELTPDEKSALAREKAGYEHNLQVRNDRNGKPKTLVYVKK